jgi:hypothetical protein
MSAHTHEGGCQCGAVRYVTSAEPQRAIACHCSSCKQRTGALYGMGVYFLDTDVQFNDGELRSYGFNSDTSDRWFNNEFCVRCGTVITWTLEMRPGVRGIAGGSFDDPNWFNVDVHIWTRSARPDMRYPGDIELHEKSIPV